MVLASVMVLSINSGLPGVKLWIDDKAVSMMVSDATVSLILFMKYVVRNFTVI